MFKAARFEDGGQRIPPERILTIETAKGAAPVVPDERTPFFRLKGFALIANAMTPAQLGEDLAQHVWESLRDLLTDEGSLGVLHRLNALEPGGGPTVRTGEELLIYLLWAYTRGIQQARTTNGPQVARAVLDALHKAVFKDMVDNGTPRDELPLFEERVRARYAQYGRAASESDQAVGEALVGAVAAGRSADLEDAGIMAAKAVGVSNPVGDFYAAVNLVED